MFSQICWIYNSAKQIQHVTFVNWSIYMQAHEFIWQSSEEKSASLQSLKPFPHLPGSLKALLFSMGSNLGPPENKRNLPFWASDLWHYCNICTRQTWELRQKVWLRSPLQLASPLHSWTHLHWLCQRAHQLLSWTEREGDSCRCSLICTGSRIHAVVERVCYAESAEIVSVWGVSIKWLSCKSFNVTTGAESKTINDYLTVTFISLPWAFFHFFSSFPLHTTHTHPFRFIFIVYGCLPACMSVNQVHT